MDFANAGLLGLIVFILVQFTGRLIPAVETDSRIKVGVIIVLAQATVFLMGATVWAHEQVIGGHALDDLNVGSKIAAGIVLAAIAAGIHNGLLAIKNIGENQE